MLGAGAWAIRAAGAQYNSSHAKGSSPAAVSQAGSARPARLAPSSPPQLGPSGPGWHLKFASDFSGSHLDPSIWTTCYPWADTGLGCTNFGNPEYEWYLPSQVQVSGGVLRLTAQRVPTQGQNQQGGPQEYSCRSGLVTTYPGLQFKYGYVQVVARVPKGPGLWPALWLAAANRQWPPEMDMMERWGNNKHTAVYFHPVGAPQVSQGWATAADMSVGWHTFGLLWTPTRLDFYIDGQPVLTVTQRIPHQLMYFIANIAESRPAGTTGCDGTMLIRSVKVWQR